MLEGFRRFVRSAVTAGGLLGGVCLLIVTFITFYEVFARYVIGKPTTWAMDYSIYLIIWATFVGSAYTLREGGHVCVEILVEKLPERVRANLKSGIYLLVCLFCCILAWRGLVSCLEAHRFGQVTLSYLRTPLYVPMSAIPLGGALLVLEILRELLDRFQGERGRPMASRRT